MSEQCVSSSLAFGNLWMKNTDLKCTDKIVSVMLILLCKFTLTRYQSHVTKCMLSCIYCNQWFQLINTKKFVLKWYFFDTSLVSGVYDCEKCKCSVLSEVIYLIVVSSSCCRTCKSVIKVEERRGVLQSPFPIVSQILPLNIFTYL